MTSSHPSPHRRGLTLIELGVVAAILFVLAMMLLPAGRSAGPAARRAHCLHTMRMIAMAMTNYAADHGQFVPAYTVDENGRPLHSWRTLLLPYLDGKALYDRIDLTKPWDDPANADLLAECPEFYQCPTTNPERSHTSYLAIRSDWSAVQPPSVETPSISIEASGDSSPPGRIFENATDKLLLIDVPASETVPWMQPTDYPVERLRTWTADTETPHPGVFNVFYLDGHGGVLSVGMSPEAKENLIAGRFPEEDDR